MSIKKNNTAHTGGYGIREIAVGYAINANPDPEFTTSWTGRLISWAMKPRILKVTNPPNNDVAQLQVEINIASL